MAEEDRSDTTTYEVYCRECDWRVNGPVDLKGTANLLAGRHISETDHVVALKSIEEPADDQELRRGGDRSVHVEVLRPASSASDAADRRRCGPVECVVEAA